jgi:hypothetical protein
MAGTFSKRQKEQSRQERQKAKLGKKLEQSALKKQSGGSGPEIDWNHSQNDFQNDEPVEEANKENQSE